MDLHLRFSTVQMAARLGFPIMWLLLLSISFLGTSTPSFAESDADFVARNLAKVTWGQYMRRGCAPVHIAAWEGLPTERCSYHSATFGVKLPVVLIVPDDQRLAKWMLTACGYAGVRNLRVCSEKLATQIKCQSGNQFAVAGLVDEGALYLFRDGVTVSVEGVGTGRNVGLTRPPSSDEAQRSLDGKVVKVHKWARIVGTGREDFSSLTGMPVEALAGSAWQETIREEFKTAWNSKGNRLISAWAKSNRSALSGEVSVDQFRQIRCPAGTRWTKWK